MNTSEWLISAFMLMSVLLTPYAPAVTTTPADHSSLSKLGKEKNEHS